MGRKLMDKQRVLDLAKRLIDENPGTLMKPEMYLIHLSDSYNIAGEVIDHIISKYSKLERYLNKQEISLAAELHDIGRPFKEDQLFHELRGARYIEKHGLEIGIADNLIDIYRIAQMFRSHLVVAEQFNDGEDNEQKKEFEPLDTSLLIPRTWQEKIVVYSELTNLNGERIHFEKRIADIKKRYALGSKWQRTNPSLANALQKGLERVIVTCEKVEFLIKGKLTEQEIAREGFL